MGPKLSILLPYRNAGATLAACLRSIKAQRFHDYELLAIDDHSEDDSARQLATAAACDPRIRRLNNPKPGLVNALNYGIAQARSPLIARMDADDRMLPQRLERQFDYLQAHPEITLLGCQTRLFPEAEIQKGLREYIRWQNRCLEPETIAADIYIESPFAHPSVIYRRAAVVRAGGYRQGDFPEDYDLWLRLHQTGHRMAKLPEVLLDWRDSPTRVSRTDPRCSREAFDRLRAHYLAQEPLLLSSCNDLVIWGAGRKTRKRCSLLLEQGFTLRAWIDIDPRKIGNRVSGAPVCSPEWLDRRPRPFVLVYVNNHGAREQIGDTLSAMNYQCRRDYLMVG